MKGRWKKIPATNQNDDDEETKNGKKRERKGPCACAKLNINPVTSQDWRAKVE